MKGVEGNKERERNGESTLNEHNPSTVGRIGRLNLDKLRDFSHQDNTEWHIERHLRTSVFKEHD